MEGHITGEMFNIVVEPVNAGEDRDVSMVASGEYCAQISHDSGSTWGVVPISVNRSIDHGLFDPADTSRVFLGEGWRLKTPGQYTQREAVHLNVNGSRELLVSSDGGKTFTAAMYERTNGFKQVYGLEAIPTPSSEADVAPSSVLVGAHSGVYLGSWTTGDRSSRSIH